MERLVASCSRLCAVVFVCLIVLRHALVSTPKAIWSRIRGLLWLAGALMLSLHLLRAKGVF